MMSAAAGRRRKHHLQLFCDLAIGLAALALILVTSRPATADEAFRAWVEELWPEAQAFGISRKTFDTAFRNLEPDLKLPDLVLPGRKQTPRGQADRKSGSAGMPPPVEPCAPSMRRRSG